MRFGAGTEQKLDRIPLANASWSTSTTENSNGQTFPGLSSPTVASGSYILRNCTKDGWTEAYPSYENVCKIVEDESETETTYYSTFRQVYTVGHATSLVSLISAIFVFTAFRKFHCTRNYIHMNLFVSFILRASAIFIKDGVLFADENLDHCSMSTINFIIFINVIRILVQKLKSPGVGGNNETGHFMRLAKSTLFLIPLFGMHYMVFAFLPENTGENARNFLELGLGPFQGFVVALLYCFLNGEVQAELKKRLWKWQTQSYLRYSKRRRTLFTESSTVTQISVLEKSSPKELPFIEP
ncbi:Pituitary adenylate cyclase-activating polypeptide type I receptor [Triplophysa tibetana]|uniref:Pituitary adenylate cyclase-activating polypeptide type I receptor n=1 Tax=Triplophysa tibetana TaxID=1572043 RepID=A0A5A9NSJ3_9TELE|nr:Pituitary adenylate cyclase-activating polypeptide type I receptor [Triplophysa tibetana]